LRPEFGQVWTTRACVCPCSSARPLPVSESALSYSETVYDSSEQTMRADLAEYCAVRNGAAGVHSSSSRWLVVAVAAVFASAILATSGNDVAAAEKDAVMARIPVGMAESEIGVIADVPNLEPQGPAAITVNPETPDVYVLDTVNGRLVQVLPPVAEGEGLPQVDLASDDPVKDVGRATDLLFANGALYVLDSLNRKVVKLDTEGQWVKTFEIKNPKIQTGGSATLVVLPNDDIRVVEAGVQELPIDPSAGRGSEADPDALTTTSASRAITSRSEWGADGRNVTLSLRSAGDDGKAISETIDVRSRDDLASAGLVGIDGRGRYYVLATELAEGDRMHTALARYSSSGDLEGVADVPIDDVVYLPNRFVTVDNKGTAYFLQPLSTEVLVVELTFQPRETVSLPEGATQERRSRSTTLIVDEDFAAAVREASKDEPYEGARGRITREQILKNAYAYLNLEWRVTPENYGKSSDNNCSAPRNWRRPKRLNGRLGDTVTAAPYKWGGYQSLSSIKSKLAAGVVAGDICTCRSKSRGYCISSGTTGVDCSGFVSKSLEEKYHTTSAMSAITKPLSGLRSLKKGDILNRAGRHVRLVAEDAPTSGPLVIKAIESAVSCGGVCEVRYTAAQLASYKPLRYKFVEEVSEAAPQAAEPTVAGASLQDEPATGTAKAGGTSFDSDRTDENRVLKTLQNWMSWLQDQFSG
jgi:hypothetical protein